MRGKLKFGTLIIPRLGDLELLTAGTQACAKKKGPDFAIRSLMISANLPVLRMP